MLAKLLSASGGTVKNYVDDLFSTYLYTGNSSTQTINNGIDLAGKGGLVWCKSRSSAEYHHLVDTERGGTHPLRSNDTSAQQTAATYLTAFNNNGFSLGSSSGMNGNALKLVAFAFRRAPKFFDVVTYTGDGAVRTITHSLGVTPGMIMVKRTDTVGDWKVQHRSITTDYLTLNSTAARTTDATVWNASFPDSTTFPIGTHVDVNANGGTYVAYLFAHDTSTDGIIQCGSFTTDASGNATVNLGWEPQYLMAKRYAGTTSTGDWNVLDSMRGWPVQNPQLSLFANTSGAESGQNLGVIPTATGFSVTGYYASTSVAYLAIRRPNKPPTSGTQVFSAMTRTGTATTAKSLNCGFAPDSFWGRRRDIAGGYHWPVFDRLRGASISSAPVIYTGQTLAESAETDTLRAFTSSGVDIGSSAIVDGTSPIINYFFRRASGFMSILCDTGTGSNKLETHNLGSVPELMIRKGRSGATQWEVYFAALGNTKKLVLNSNAAAVTDTTAWNSTTPTSTQISIGTGANVNIVSATYVTYLFSSLAGISKTGTYTGNGGTQVIPCGFSTGCRFVLIKRTDAPGDWFVWDSARGIVAGNAPHLSLNTTAAEVTTDDSVDADVSGFIVNQNTDTNINVTSASYIFLAIA